MQWFGMHMCQSNHSVFSSITERDRERIPLIVYVDDIIIIGNDTQGIVDLKNFLQGLFHTKDLDKL